MRICSNFVTKELPVFGLIIETHVHFRHITGDHTRNTPHLRRNAGRWLSATPPISGVLFYRTRDVTTAICRRIPIRLRALNVHYHPKSDLLNNRIILITGAGDGIGREAALTYARFGAQVILLGRTESKLASVQQEIAARNLRPAFIYSLDLLTASQQDCQRVADQIAQWVPHLDGVLHNAGLLTEITPMAEIKLQDWMDVMQVNVNATFMLTQALLPLLIHNGEPKSALVIGFGTGITAGALLRYPGLEHRVVAELLPSVVQAAPLVKGNYNAASDPGVEVRLRDGRQELLRNPQAYDLITLEPPPPSAAGVVNLYSKDFYRLAATRLEKNGLLAQWLPLPTQNIDDSRALVRSFLDVFPYASLWTSEFHEMLLVGSLEPINLDAERIRQRFEQPDVRSALSDVGIDSAATLLATWVTDRQGLERFAADAPAVTDDQPHIEYAPWVRAKEITRVLPALLDLRTPVPLVNADATFTRTLRAEQQRLMQFYRASLHADDGDRDAWGRDIREVLQQDSANPYYRWFITP